MRIGQIELFLLQIIIYTVIYVINDYIGFLVCLILGTIAIALLILSLVFEFIDKSKVPGSYYLFMFNAAFAPFIVLLFFSIFITGSFDWMQE